VIRLLVSVRSVEESVLAADGGADFIDLKEPAQGALGGLPVATIRSIVAALRERGCQLPVSATIGDVPMQSPGEIAARVEAVGDCGVDYVKVGIERGIGAREVLAWLAVCGRPIVPVFIADHGLDADLVRHAASLGFPGLMADTADKRAGSLFDVLSLDDLRRFIAIARTNRAMAGIAGALRITHAPMLASITPDFAGFRTAVCAGDRSAALDPARLQALAEAMHAAQASCARTSPISSERIQASSVL
jgi:(5-formylfuran-3-yl)methyl phosphate synthase